MVEIESFNFSSDMPGRRVMAGAQRLEYGMSAVSDPVRASEELTAELEAYNRAFSELELPWRWDAQTLRHLLTVAPDRDCVGAYVELNQPHLLRVYEKAFLRDLVSSARERCRQEASNPA
jgi:hypothetical protein